MRRHPLRVMPVLSTKDLAARLDIYTGTLGWTRGLGIPGLDGNEVFAIDSMNNGVVFGLSALPSPEPKRTGVVLMCYVDDAVDSVDRLRTIADHFLPSHDYRVFTDGTPIQEIGAGHLSKRPRIPTWARRRAPWVPPDAE